MRKKEVNTNLILNKTTIANLGRMDLEAVKGAGTGITCNYCDTNISCYIQKCLVDFTLDTCTTLPTQTREVTCP